MTWEQRGGQRYYYRAHKVGSRVVKEYVGCGPLAERTAAADERTRAARAESVNSRRVERKELTAIDSLLTPFAESTDVLMQAVLIAVGYHRHHGGDWRKRRHG